MVNAWLVGARRASRLCGALASASYRPVALRVVPTGELGRSSAGSWPLAPPQLSLSIRHSSASSSSGGSPPASLKSCATCQTTQPLESLSCPTCSSLQPLPSTIDFYKALGLSLDTVPRNGWDIDPAALKREWRQRMAVTHPDRMSGRSEKEQQIGAQQSALINRAYETLLHPLLRAQYLLSRFGAGEVGEAESLEDPELLMEVMELREKLEEAQDEDEAAAVREENAVFLDKAVRTLGEAFGSNPPDLETAHKVAVELRYWTNIDKAAREWSPGQRIELQH